VCQQDQEIRAARRKSCTYNTDITGLVVKRPGSALGAKHGHTGAAANKERPLIRIWVPVHLAQRARLDGDVGGSNGLG